MQVRFTCKACARPYKLLVWGYCPPCLDELREMVDECEVYLRRVMIAEEQVKPQDGDSYDDAKWEADNGS